MEGNILYTGIYISRLSHFEKAAILSKLDIEDKLGSKTPLHRAPAHQKPINNSQNERKQPEKIMPFLL